MRKNFPITELCEALGVSRSGYHKLGKREPSKRRRANEQLLHQIRIIHSDRHTRCYGSPRMTRELRALGIGCSENRVARIMRSKDLRARPRRPFRPKTTQPDHAAHPSPNLLSEAGSPSAPGAQLVSDITYIPTREGWLYLAVVIDRPGNVVSHEGCVPWINRAIKLVAPHAGQITLRGDTDFTLTGELDRWDEQGVKFIFGMDAHHKVVNLAEALPEEAWRPLKRLPRYEIVSRPRRKPERVKESIIRFKGYENKVLVGEDITEIEYQPLKCSRPYRLIIVRKNISVQKGEQVLFDEIRYFFYITNRDDYGLEQIVSLANGRCNQENVIEQLKNGVNAMRMPVDDLLSNWAYMVMTALAWNLKAWFGLLLPNARRGAELIKMEFRRFLHAIVLLPAQIVRTGRRVIYRIMSYNSWLKDLFAGWEHLRWLRAT